MIGHDSLEFRLSHCDGCIVEGPPAGLGEGEQLPPCARPWRRFVIGEGYIMVACIEPPEGRGPGSVLEPGDGAFLDLCPFCQHAYTLAEFAEMATGKQERLPPCT